MLPWRSSAFHISGAFCLLAAWFALASGWRMLAVVLSAAAVHELGHYLVLRSCGAKISGLRISIFGAVMETESGQLSYGKELAAVLAGPAANLLWALALAAFGGDRQTVSAGANLVLCIFNLLPVRPLDGGRALELLVTWCGGPAAGEWAARWVGACAALALAAGVVFLMWRSGGSMWLLPAACGLMGAALREMVGKS